MKYKCVQGFKVDKYEDDVLCEDIMFYVDKGSIWKLTDSILLVKSDIRLEKEDGEW